MNRNDEERTLKITLIGEHFVGKTSLIGRFVDGTFDTTYSATIGFSLLSKTVKYNDEVYNLDIWDTSGSEKHRAVAPNYYRGTDGCILVYDVSDPKSLEPLSYWYDEFSTYVKTGSDPNSVPTLLLGNKCDLGYEETTVNEAKQFADTHDIGGENHFIVSACSGENVEAAFEKLVSLCAEHQEHVFQSVSLRQAPERGSSCC